MEFNPDQARENSAAQFEEHQGLIDRISDTISRKTENVRQNIRTYVAIGASALSLAGGTLASETAFADATPVTTNGSKAECAGKILKSPSIKASMANPGTPENEFTGIKFRFNYGTCDRWQLAAVYRQQQKIDGKWVGKDDGNYWYPLTISHSEGNGTNEALTADAGNPSMHHPDSCVDGKRPPNRIQERSLMESVATGKVVAKGKIKNVHVSYESASAKHC